MIKRVIGAAAVSLLLVGAGAHVATPAQAASFVSTSVAAPAPGSLVKGPDGKTYEIGSVPKGVVAPKGNPSTRRDMTGTTLRSLTTCPGTTPKCYHYSGGQQFVMADGVYANLKPFAPFVATYDYHSLEEITAEAAGTGGQNIIEVGWTVDRQGVNGLDYTNPHLFVGRWLNGAFGGYNGGGFVQLASPAPQAGQAVTTDINISKTFSILHSGTAWWVGYNGSWAGYFPDTIWTGAFVQGSLFQGFMEVASKYTRSCTDMGSGVLGSASGGTGIGQVGSWAIQNAPAGTVNDMTPFAVDGVLQPSTDYNGTILTGTLRTGQGGGPGGNSTGTGSGAAGTC
jgi:neprosin-like protein